MHHATICPINTDGRYHGLSYITEAQVDHWTRFTDQDDRIADIHNLLVDIDTNMPRRLAQSYTACEQFVNALAEAHGYCRYMLVNNIPFINHHLNNALYATEARSMVFQYGDRGTTHVFDFGNEVVEAREIIVHQDALDRFIQLRQYIMYDHGVARPHVTGTWETLHEGSHFEENSIYLFLEFMAQLAMISDLYDMIETRLRQIKHECTPIMTATFLSHLRKK